MKVLYVCTEIFPLLKTGGLGDVSAALPPALRAAGCDVRILVPGFPAFRGTVQPQAAPLTLYPGGPDLGGGVPAGSAAVRHATLPGTGLAAYVLDVPALFDRPGDPYSNDRGDNVVRFGLLGWAAACLGQGLDAHWQPDVVHCHDWHAGLGPLYLRQQSQHGATRPASVFTIHNLAYQGTFPRWDFGRLGLPDHLFGIDGIEFYDQVSFMKGGVQFADAITTVSPTYAHEILRPDQGCGLDGLLRARSGVLSGILNGVDYEVWSPANDAQLPEPYDADSLARKAAAKSALQRHLCLQERGDALLVGVVSRLTEQKGLHLVQAVTDELVHLGAQLVVLGTGDAGLEHAFREAAARHPGQMVMSLGYDEALAHRVMGGADVILVPSRFEPCGLTQLYGLRYGALPVVHRVGGLADTVVDVTAHNLAAELATGFAFDEFTPHGLLGALHRARALYAQPEQWAAVQRHAMRQRFDWGEAAAQYLALFQGIAPRVG